MKNSVLKLVLGSICGLISLNASAGINWSEYDDAPAFFLGWEASFYFAIGTIALFGLSWLLTKFYKDKNGCVEGGVGCFVGIVNTSMIICAICSCYLLIPLSIIYTILSALIKRKK